MGASQSSSFVDLNLSYARVGAVAQRHAVQGAEGAPASSPRAAAVTSGSIGIPPHLLLPTFDFRCQTMSRPTTSDEQRMESRFSQEAWELPKLGDCTSHDYINPERTARRTACHAHTTGRVVAGVGGGPRAAAREGKGPAPRP